MCIAFSAKIMLAFVISDNGNLYETTLNVFSKSIYMRANTLIVKIVSKAR